jgi:hypothetical protein
MALDRLALFSIVVAASLNRLRSILQMEAEGLTVERDVGEPPLHGREAK